MVFMTTYSYDKTYNSGETLTFKMNVFRLMDNNPLVFIMFFVLFVAVILNFIFTMTHLNKKSGLGIVLVPGILLVLSYAVFLIHAANEVNELNEVWYTSATLSAQYPFLIMCLLFAGNIVFSRLANKHYPERVKAVEQQAKVPTEQTDAPKVTEIDEIMQYKKLLDAGIITQEEFDAKKKELLNL